jgi:hypothetical protein
VTAALLTGARAPGEVAGACVYDFRLLSVTGKTGPRDITLSTAAVHFFEQLAAGRAPTCCFCRKTTAPRSETALDTISGFQR